MSTDPAIIHIHTDFAAWARAADMIDVEVYSVEDDIPTADIGSDIEFLRMDEIPPEPSGIMVLIQPER